MKLTCLFDSVGSPFIPLLMDYKFLRLYSMVLVMIGRGKSKQQKSSMAALFILYK
jgi:hypothetical protein